MTGSLPLGCLSCRSETCIVAQTQHLVASRKEHWYNQSFGDFLLVEKVEQIEADDKAVGADNLLISRVLELCKLQQLLRLC